MMVKKSDGELIAGALLKIAEAVENVSNSIDELATQTEPTDMSEVASEISKLGTFSDVLYQCIDHTGGLKLSGDIGVTKND